MEKNQQSGMNNFLANMNIRRPLSLIAGIFALIAIVSKNFLVYFDYGDGKFELSLNEICEMFKRTKSGLSYSIVFLLMIGLFVMAIVDAFKPIYSWLRNGYGLITFILAIRLIIYFTNNGGSSDYCTRGIAANLCLIACVVFMISALWDVKKVVVYSYEDLRKTTQQLNQMQPGSGWACDKCGRTNANYVGTCGCGNSRSN